MSKQRYLDTRFWDDGYIVDKDPIEKLLFIYLLTNPLTNILGIYEISLRRIAFDTGIDREMVLKILKRFEEGDKIKYEDGWVALKNFMKHQKSNPKIDKGIETLIQEVSNRIGMSYISVYNYCRTGKIPCVQFDRVYRVSERELNKWLKSKKVEVKNIKKGE